ncbi:MAG: SHOCT domain-containing protein [Desulfobacterales bacterium]
MKANSLKASNGVIKSIFIAYFILVLHVLLVAGLIVLIIFLRGIVSYMLWIFLAGAGIILFSAYRFYKKMKRERKTLKEMMNSPMFRGREVEISFLGGMASLKVGKPQQSLIEHYPGEIKQLEDPDALHLRELNELVRLFENNLITLEEYNQAKKQIFSSN